jgi:aspartate/methionine/tyrosine aminotransferase
MTRPLATIDLNQETLTTWQSRSLRNQYNLADAHARDNLLPFERAAAQAASSWLLKPYEDIDQTAVEDEFVQVFAAVAGESYDLLRRRSRTFQYSASRSISTAGHALKRAGRETVGVLHPSFDNIPQLLKRSGLSVSPVAQPRNCRGPLEVPDTIDALFLTIPNNPTGWVPSRDVLVATATECARRGTALVIDLSFRFQGNLRYPVYDTLAAVDGLELITIEDSGKTWNLNDLKCSLVTFESSDLELTAASAMDEDLLLVSPVYLGIVTAVMHMAVGGTDNPLDERRDLAKRNFLTLAKEMEQAGFVDTRMRREIARREKQSGFVWWLALDRSWNAPAVAAFAERRGVSVLPGDQFCWASEDPTPHLRIALLREAEYFAGGAQLLAKSLAEYRRDA